MIVGWLLFGVSAVLAAAALVLAVAGASFPPLLLASGVVAVASYSAWSKARERLVDGVYDRVGVEPNPDGTVGDEGARAERTATGRVAFEPRDDWDDPEDWPFDDPFWTDEEVETPSWAERGVGGDEGVADRVTDGDRRSRRENAPGARGAAGDRGDRGGGGDCTGSGDRVVGGGRSVGRGTRLVSPRTREACDVLGVDVDVSPAELRTAYRERVMETHPDHGGDEASFRRVRRAYEHLRARRE